MGETDGRTIETAEPGLPGAGGDPYEPIEQPPAAASTPFEQLVNELTADLVVKPLPLAVPGRPLYAVVYHPDLTGAQIDHARNASRKGGSKSMVRRGQDQGDIDGVQYTARICIATCAEILRDGEVIRDEQGRPFTFNHTGFMRALGVQTAIDCVRTFYARDASIAAAADRILAEAGWNDEATEVDDVGPLDPQTAG